MMILIKKSLIRVPVEMILAFINLHIVEKIRQLIEAKCFVVGVVTCVVYRTASGIDFSHV